MRYFFQRGIASPFLVIAFFLISLLALSFLLRGRISFLNFAALDKPSLVRGLANDLTADVVLGQPDFNQAIPGTVTPYKVAHPGGVYVDKSVTPNRVYIYDGLNSRMLGYKSLGKCQNSPATACTSDSDCGISDSCKIDRIGPGSDKKPDIIIGQKASNTSACNGDGTHNTSNNFPVPSASSLCGVPPSEPSPAEGGSWQSPATDSEGNLYMADFYNNRVLKYNDPFNSDVIADDVWGQPDFTSFKCDRGGPVSNSGFCFINYAPVKPVVGGVDIDKKGNLWVVDGGNNRVLRFPKVGNSIKKEADLVLGQPNFTSKSPGVDLNKLNAPTVVRVNTAGTVYVGDAQNGRVLYYPSPTTGMTGKLLSGTSKKAGGIEFDIKKDSDPNSGGIWVTETDNHQIALFSETGEVKKVLSKDTYRPNGNHEGHSNCPTQYDEDLCSLNTPRGSMGVTRDGDVIVAGSYSESALYYKHPIPTPTPGKSYEAVTRFFAPPFTANAFDSKSLLGPRGIAATDDQLIVSDHAKIMFWNNPSYTSSDNGRAADGVLMTTDFFKFLDPYFFRITTSDNNLWAIYQNSLLRFSLPLSHGEMYAERLQFSDLKYINNNERVGFETFASDIYASPDDRYLWLSFPNQNRVARVLVPENYQGDYKIDAIIGGATIPENKSIWHEPCPPNLDQPCAPGSVTKDRYGNIVVSDYFLENEGTGDIFFFKDSLFPFDNKLKVKSINANFKKFPDVHGWQPIFGPNNEMIIGTAAFFDGSLRFPAIYKDPTTTSRLQKIGELAENYTQAFSGTFDPLGNLLVTDMNRGRVLAYLNPLKQITNDLPIARFSYSPHSGESPLTVKFTNNTEVPKGDKFSYLWDFGDGTTSTETSPSHKYKFVSAKKDDQKIFYASLKVTNSKGFSSNPRTKSVTVSAEKAQVQINIKHTILPKKQSKTGVKLSILTENLTTVMDQVVWDFGDGSPISTAISPTHYYQTGKYTIKVTILDKNKNTYTAKKIITIN